jgi:hypothetical protein
VAASEGLRVLLIEKSAQIGGTTAVSGVMVWIPANAKMRVAGLVDSLHRARDYLRQCVPGNFNENLRSVFLASGDAAIAHLEQRTSVRFRPVVNYPDYYPDLPGATAGGRVLEPVPFDGRKLGNRATANPDGPCARRREQRARRIETAVRSNKEPMTEKKMRCADKTP